MFVNINNQVQLDIHMVILFFISLIAIFDIILLLYLLSMTGVNLNLDMVVKIE